MSLHSLTQDFIDAHTQYELARIQKQLPNDIEQGVANFLSTVGKLPLNDYFPSDAFNRLIIDILTQTEPTDALRASIVRATQTFYEDDCHTQHTLGDLITDQQIDAYIDHSLNMESLRRELTERALKSTVYKDLVAGLVFSAIEAYVEESTALTERVPGAKAMLKMGKGFLQKAAPKLEDRMEEQLKKFIQLLMPELVEQSIRLLDNLSNEQLHTVYTNIWNTVKNAPTAQARDYLDQKQLNGYVDLNYAQYQHTRHSTYLHALIQCAVNAFYTEYQAKPLNTLLKDAGIAESQLADWLNHALQTVLPSLIKSGWLESLLRERLSDFYTSDTAQSLFKKA